MGKTKPKNKRPRRKKKGPKKLTMSQRVALAYIKKQEAKQTDVNDK